MTRSEKRMENNNEISPFSEADPGTLPYET